MNTGDLIARWTNGVFRSSPHRVVNPTGPAANKDRYSFVLFHSPNPDAVISCLESCQGPGNPPKYPPITAGEHLRARAEASRKHGYWRIVAVVSRLLVTFSPNRYSSARST